VIVKTTEALNVVKVEANYNSACISAEGELFMWGKGSFGEFGFPQKIMTISGKVKDVSLGLTVGVATDEQGIAWTWGPNENGELGVGDQEARVHPFPVLGLKGKSVTAAQCGDSFTVCLG
jgi:X-linked retinitis pigmentosa GTPase regulator